MNRIVSDSGSGIGADTFTPITPWSNSHQGPSTPPPEKFSPQGSVLFAAAGLGELSFTCTIWFLRGTPTLFLSRVDLILEYRIL